MNHRKDPEDTLLQTTHTLSDDPSLWVSESAPLSERERRNAISWRILYGFALFSLLLIASMVIFLWWPGHAHNDMVSFMLKAKVVEVLCFICGINWGVGLRYAAVTQQMPSFIFLWAPLPAYLAWPCLLMPMPWFLLCTAALYAWAHWVDHDLWSSSGLSPWLRLRLKFTFAIVTLCLLGAAGAWFRGYA